MAETKFKGDLGQSMILADVMRRGYKVALPIGEDWRFDLIVFREARLERVQCKYTESDGDVVIVKCRSTNGWGTYKYTNTDIDWMAVYDKTTEKCFYFPSSLLEGGRSELYFRLVPPKNAQAKSIRYAKDYEAF